MYASETPTQRTQTGYGFHYIIACFQILMLTAIQSFSPDIEKTKNWIKKTKKTVWERMAIFVNKYDRRQWGSWCFFTLTPNTYTPHYETPEFGAIFNLHRLLYKSSVKTRLWQYIFCIAVSLYPCEDTQCIHTYSTILCSKCPSDLFRSVCIVKTGHNNQ